MLVAVVAFAFAAPPAAPDPPPPMRAFAEIPYVTPRAGFLQTEDEAVDLVRSLVADRVRDGREIRVVFADAAQKPEYADGAIRMQRFVTRDPAFVRREFADAGASSDGWTDAELVDAWHALHVAALARGYGLAIRDSWDRLDAANPGADDRLAWTLAGAVLDTLAKEGRVPAGWPALARRLGPAFGATIPEAALDEALFASIGAYDGLERDLVERTLASFAEGAGLGAPVTKHDGDGPLVAAVASDAGSLAVWTFAGNAVVRAAAPVPLTRGQAKKAARVVNAWNHDLRGYTVLVHDGAVLVTSGQVRWDEASELRQSVDGAWEVLGVVAPALRTLADGGSVDEVTALPRPLFEEKEMVTW